MKKIEFKVGDKVQLKGTQIKGEITNIIWPENEYQVKTPIGDYTSRTNFDFYHGDALELIESVKKPKFEFGDKVIATYQYDMMDSTRSEGIIVGIDLHTGDEIRYQVRCDKNPLMHGWFDEQCVELLPETDKYGNSVEEEKAELRKVGDIMLDLEPLLFELHLGHDLQHSDVLGLINFWQTVHVPEQLEEYEDGTHPVLVRPVLYGPRPKEKKLKM